MRTRELVAVLSGVAVAVAASVAFDIEPKTAESLVLVVPAVVVTIGVGVLLRADEDGE